MPCPGGISCSRATGFGQHRRPRVGLESKLVKPLSGGSCAVLDHSKSQIPLSRSPALEHYFKVEHFAGQPGQVLKVVGSLPELGNWNPHKAPSMERRVRDDSDTWHLKITVPEQPFQFKLVVTDGSHAVWEEGDVRHVPSKLTVQTCGPVGNIVRVNCVFGLTGDALHGAVFTEEDFPQGKELAEWVEHMGQHNWDSFKRNHIGSRVPQRPEYVQDETLEGRTWAQYYLAVTAFNWD